MKNSETGKLGEESVCVYLTERGYRIAARNYRIKGGEIDIIAENGDYIAFVEVKSRKPQSLVSGFKHPNLLQPRFDVAQVIIDGGRVLSIDYITNAYDTIGYNYIF